MEYKRLEIYVWWTCNQKCNYCKEFPNMEIMWDKKVTKFEILKLLIKYKKKWYNHVSYLWWEPFIQWVFYDALKLWKKMWFTILVTTNCTTLHINKQSEKFLPYIDELILSMEAIDIEKQQLISRTKVNVNWKEVFINIKKYWSWKMLKVNIVIVKDNLDELFNMVKLSNKNWVKEIAITYPDIDLDYYWKKHILDNIAPKYSECIIKILPIIEYCKKYKIRLKLPDFPFCIFPIDRIYEYIKFTDDYDYQTRINIYQNKIKIDRWDLSDYNFSPRERQHEEECLDCKYNNLCWWPSRYYKNIFWYSEIKAIK